MKKIAYVFILVVLLVGLQAPSAQAAKRPPVHINIWMTVSADLPAVAQLIGEFLAGTPVTKVTYTVFSNLVDELEATRSSNKLPHLIWAANDNIGYLAKQGWIIDLDQFGITPGYLKSNFTTATVGAVQDSEKIWGLPESQEGIGLVYNKTLVAAEYLPTDPLDFTTLRNKADDFMLYTGKPLICNQGFPGTDSYHAAPVYFGFGVPTYIDSAGTVYVNTTEAVAAGAWIASMPPLSPLVQDYASCQDAFIADQVGMWWTGPWALGALNAAEKDYSILPMGKPFVGVKTLMVTQEAQNRGYAEIVVELAKYLTSTESAVRLSQINSTIPANAQALADERVLEIPTVAPFIAVMADGVPMLPSIFSSCQWEPLHVAGVAIWAGEPVQAALDQAQLEIEACVATYMSP